MPVDFTSFACGIVLQTTLYTAWYEKRAQHLSHWIAHGPSSLVGALRIPSSNKCTYTYCSLIYLNKSMHGQMAERSKASR